MKNLFAYFALCLTVVFGLAVSSCGENLCKDPEKCGTHGTCNSTDGACVCETGYQANSKGACDSVSRDKFLATYNVKDICPSGEYNYTVTIATTTAGIEKVILRNFGSYSVGTAQLEVVGTIEGSKLSIASQTITLGAKTFVVDAASATLTGNSFSFNSKITVDGASETCASTYTKQ